MKVIVKVVACWTAFVVSLIVAGFAIGILHLHPIAPPPGRAVSQAFLGAVLGGAVLVVGLSPVAAGLGGSRDMRGATLFAFLLLALGINQILEAQAFTHLLDHAAPASILMAFAEALVLGVALALCFGAKGGARGVPAAAWPLRLLKVAAAWLVFPAIWWLFGMCVIPFVGRFYRSGFAGLHIPSLGVIADTELLRSALFLLGSLPLIALWKSSRLRLWLALGLGHATVVGYYGLVQASFLPGVMRIAHGLEITADSFVYAGVLVLLFGAREAGERSRPVPAAVQEIHA